MKPWSTKTHVSWSPTALWTSSAATAESTPPERAQSTRSAPDLRADPLDLLLDHGGRRPRGRRAGDVVEEVLEQVLAVRRVHDLGVELDAVEPALRGPRTRRSASTATPATTRRPRAARSTESRWLIQTVCSLAAARRRAPRCRPRARSCRTRTTPVRVDRRRRARAPSAACRSRSRASGRRARRAPGRCCGASVGVDRSRPAGEDQRQRVARAAPPRRASVCGTSSE